MHGQAKLLITHNVSVNCNLSNTDFEFEKVVFGNLLLKTQISAPGISFSTFVMVILARSEQE
ncbi:hypothetical protein CP500_021770 [Tychonema bourrellyi FEM_GT703]|uniref:Uncharacterized protein n=1 Tax=Tychonema bourrellyi FEM_GT703 TaxID=2040638 RepID=A0A2G4EV33_9CYAN|nr:hypothetical protein CP500_021770 [Tychonema bourrellyi FEM_GT703]